MVSQKQSLDRKEERKSGLSELGSPIGLCEFDSRTYNILLIYSRKFVFAQLGYVLVLHSTSQQTKALVRVLSLVRALPLLLLGAG